MKRTNALVLAFAGSLLSLPPVFADNYPGTTVPVELAVTAADVPALLADGWTQVSPYVFVKDLNGDGTIDTTTEVRILVGPTS